MKLIILLICLLTTPATAGEYGTRVAEYNTLMDEYRPPKMIDPPPILPPPISILVDRSNFTMAMHSDGILVNTRKVILGRADNPTPALTTQFSRIIINPVWKVPSSLQSNLINIIKTQRDPIEYLERRHFNVHVEGNKIEPTTIDWRTTAETAPYPFYITQDPGPSNFVGQVLFVLEDTDEIQMHDTPNKNLFLQDVRSFSSGCIRVENSQELAEFILRQPIGALIESGETVVFTLPRPVILVVD